MAALGGLSWCVVHRNNVGRANHFDASTGRVDRVAYGVGGVGAPDLLVELETAPGSGRWLACWLEVKALDGELSVDQRRWHEAAQRRGRHVYVVRSASDALAAVTAVRMAGAGNTGSGRAA